MYCLHFTITPSPIIPHIFALLAYMMMMMLTLLASTTSFFSPLLVHWFLYMLYANILSLRKKIDTYERKKFFLCFLQQGGCIFLFWTFSWYHDDEDGDGVPGQGSLLHMFSFYVLQLCFPLSRPAAIGIQAWTLLTLSSWLSTCPGVQPDWSPPFGRQLRQLQPKQSSQSPLAQTSWQTHWWEGIVIVGGLDIRKTSTTSLRGRLICCLLSKRWTREMWNLCKVHVYQSCLHRLCPSMPFEKDTE